MAGCGLARFGAVECGWCWRVGPFVNGGGVRLRAALSCGGAAGRGVGVRGVSAAGVGGSGGGECGGGVVLVELEDVAGKVRECPFAAGCGKTAAAEGA